MNLNDSIGQRGEKIFSVLITRWCDGHPWFTDTFQGDKHETTDFLVELVEPTAGHACFFVQVKSTRSNYKGTGARRKLDVTVPRKDVEKLKKMPVPTYVVGIDVDRVCGFIVGITQATSGSINGIPVRHSLNCRTLKALWKEIDDYWKARAILSQKSKFTD